VGAPPTAPSPSEEPTSKGRVGGGPAGEVSGPEARSSDDRPASLDDVERSAAEIVSSVSAVVLGAADTVRLAVVCLLAEGHLLLEDVPGVGKTTLARCLAAAIGAKWRRIQCTPDLLPSDLTGVHVPSAGGQLEPASADLLSYTSLTLRPGPLFANVVMADELNRAAPRTQSALLEAMEERQVSLDGVTYPLPEPFLVIATQNPADFEGTYPLPESQLDRFLMRLSLGYPNRSAELELLHRSGAASPAPATAAQVTTPERLRGLGKLVSREVHASEWICAYLVELATASRSDPRLAPGISPRALLGLLAAAKGLAAVEGRSFVIPDDILTLAQPVLAHRLGLGVVGSGGEVTTALSELVGRVDPPVTVS